jgi:hypothetical protein
MIRYRVTHEGVPIGLVDLEMDDHQGVGTLEPEPAYEALAPALRSVAALGARARTELMTLPLDAKPSKPEMQRAAALSFELWDERGAYVPATVVRLVELTTRPGVTVFVEFGRATLSIPVRRAPENGSAPDHINPRDA